MHRHLQSRETRNLGSRIWRGGRKGGRGGGRLNAKRANVGYVALDPLLLTVHRASRVSVRNLRLINSDQTDRPRDRWRCRHEGGETIGWSELYVMLELRRKYARYARPSRWMLEYLSLFFFCFFNVPTFDVLCVAVYCSKVVPPRCGEPLCIFSPGIEGLSGEACVAFVEYCFRRISSSENELWTSQNASACRARWISFRYQAGSDKTLA